MSESKRFKRDFTSLEQLPNELFIEIFAFLNGVDTVYAFAQLNTRFQSLLIQYVNTFDFKSISKSKFHYVIQHHDIHQWRSLRLSEDDETPGQIRLFCLLYPPHQYISQLQSLCALNMTFKYAEEFLCQLVSFDHLVSLEIGNICGENIQPFELPLLKRLIVTACKHTNWMRDFSSLESLEYNINYRCHDVHVLTIPTTLKQLKLFCHEGIDGNTVRASLRQSSRLTKLALYDNRSHSSLPNGETWKQLIQSSLPLLKTFQFCFRFHRYGNILNHIQQAIASFSSPFYVFEKRWFIRCNYDCRYSGRAILYSLPFAFAEMPIDVTSFDKSMSTLIASNMDETKYESYEKIKTLIFNENCQMPYQGFLTFNTVRLILKVALLASWYFLLSNLRHLELKSTFDMSSTDFVHFLANMPQLHSLILPISILSKLTGKFKNNTVCDHLSQGIQSLTISHEHLSEGNLGYVNAQDLSCLVRIFGKTCAHLALGLAVHPNSVLPIFQRMQQLRSLHIYYRPQFDRSLNTATCWLERTLTKADVSDFMYTSDNYNFYIWFGHRA